MAQPVRVDGVRRGPVAEPTARRRLDGEEMLRRDEQIARLRARGVKFRVIAARFNMSIGSVQQSLKRTQEGRRPGQRVRE